MEKNCENCRYISSDFSGIIRCKHKNFPWTGRGVYKSPWAGLDFYCKYWEEKDAPQKEYAIDGVTLARADCVNKQMELIHDSLNRIKIILEYHIIEHRTVDFHSLYNLLNKLGDSILKDC